MANSYPTGLGSGGRALWQAITSEHTLDATQTVQLEETCRAKDRLDRLDEILRGDDAEKFAAALSQANATANLMKQLIAALRLPDAVTGKKPQVRGPRGAYKPTAVNGQISSLDRARSAKSS